MNNKEFLEKVSEIIKYISFETDIYDFSDVQRLYCGNAVGGYFPPSKAIINLRQSLVCYKIPITREVALILKECIEYAETLDNYSLFLCGPNRQVITFPTYVKGMKLGCLN